MGAHWLLIVRNLEEAEFVAVLVCPLTQAGVDIYGCITEQSGIVLGVRKSTVLGLRSKLIHQSFRAFFPSSCDGFAQLNSSAILNCCSENISIEVPELVL